MRTMTVNTYYDYFFILEKYLFGHYNGNDDCFRNRSERD